MNRTIDVSWARQPQVLRDVARRVAKRSHTQSELLLLATDDAGAPLALNSLLALDALKYHHVLLVAYETRACDTMRRAISALPGHLATVSLADTPCLVDSWYEKTLPALERPPTTAPRQRQWLVR